MQTKVWYVIDTFNKTRLPGYFLSTEKAIKKAKECDKLTRKGRFLVNDALLVEMRDEEAQRHTGMWPVAYFKQEAFGKWD